MSAYEEFNEEEHRLRHGIAGNNDGDFLDRYALHENLSAGNNGVASRPTAFMSSEDDGMLLNLSGNGLQSTDRPLVTPPTTETMIHLTPDPSDDLSLGRGEPFVNVTKEEGRPSYGTGGHNDDDDVDDVQEEEEEDDNDDEEVTSPTSRPSASAPPDSPTLSTGLLRHSNPYQYTEEEEETAELDQFDPLKEHREDLRSIKPTVNTEELSNYNNKMADEQQHDHHLHDEHEQIEEIEHEYLNGDFVVPPPMPPHGHDDVDERSSSPDEQKPVEKSSSTSDSASCKQCPLNSLGAWFKADNLDPRVAELIYWRDVKKSGIAFGSGLALLLSLAYCSLISVVAYLLLGVMAGTLSYRVYKTVLQAVQKSNDGHPFKAYLDIDLNLPSEKVHDVSEVAVKHLECVAKELRRLFLVEDLVDSIKFALFLWCCTYIGAWFNGLTLVILAFISLFTLPKVYETHKTEIDRYIALAATQIKGVVDKVKAKVPIGKKQKDQ